MRKATKSDEKRIIDIISETFPTNPSVLSVLKNDHKESKRMRWLARYVFRYSLRRDSLFLSSDEEAVAVCYRFNGRKDTLIDYWDQFILALKAISLERIWKVLKRDAYVKSKRPASGGFLYFWFFGASQKGKGQGGAHELKEAIFEEARTTNLPIYLETSIPLNKKVYERYGFETYHTWDYKSEGITLWFMKREQF